MPRPWLVTIAPLVANIFPNKPATTVPNNISGSASLYPFVSFLIVPVTPFINQSKSLRDLAIFMIYFISMFDIINVVIHVPEVPDPKIF